MKTAIFINTAAKMANYDLPALRRFQTRMVALVSPEEEPIFQQRFGDCFDRIIVVPSSHDETGFGLLNYEDCKAAVAGEEPDPKKTYIICQSEDNLLLASRLREDFGLAGMTYEHTVKFRDKLAMKEVMRRAGVRVPRFRRINRKLDLDQLHLELSEELGLPYIVKPTRRLGGIGVALIESAARLKDYMGTVDHDDPINAEEYLKGKLYHCDSLIQNGEFLFTVVSEYSHPNFDFQLGRPIFSFPLNPKSEIAQIARMFNQQVIDAMGLRTGVTHHEFFVTESGELVFLEIAARCPGAIVTPMYRKAFGVSLENASFALAIGEDPLVPAGAGQSLPQICYFSGILPIVHGKVVGCIEPGLASEFTMNWKVKPGDDLGTCASLRDKAADLTAWSPDYEQLRSDFDAIRNFECLRVLTPAEVRECSAT
jgi:biotin carboxylase